MNTRNSTLSEFGFKAVYFFIGTYMLIAFDYVFNNDLFLVGVLAVLGLGTYFGVRWVISKRKEERYAKINPIINNQ